MPHLRASFITMFHEPVRAYLDCSIIARAAQKGIIETHIESILESVSFNHHKVDDTPYGGGPGELMRIDVIAPLINRALSRHQDIERKQKRVILMDPAGKVFKQKDAKRLANFRELIFICGRYEGIDARVHHYVDEAISIGDFVLSSGDLAAMTIFDATARMIDGVVNNQSSLLCESHIDGRLESSHYTRPMVYDGHGVPAVFQGGNHAEIKKIRSLESAYRTMMVRPDLVDAYPLSHQEQSHINDVKKCPLAFPWMKKDE